MLGNKLAVWNWEMLYVNIICVPVGYPCRRSVKTTSYGWAVGIGKVSRFWMWFQVRLGKPFKKTLQRNDSAFATRDKQDGQIILSSNYQPSSQTSSFIPREWWSGLPSEVAGMTKTFIKFSGKICITLLSSTQSPLSSKGDPFIAVYVIGQWE